MKFIHTGDWHIGKIVNQVYMTEDQSYLLAELADLIAAERPNALVIAGDLYDRAVPPIEAVELLDRFLSRVVLDLHVPVLAIAGNHDSPDRIGFGSAIVMPQGLYIEGRLKNPISKVELHDEYGPVHFYLLPYAPPGQVRDLLPQAEIQDHDSAMRALLAALTEELHSGARNVLVTHGYIRGATELELSESEKPLSIGGTDYVSAEYFAPFTYTALGHLHGPQNVAGGRIRYAGSLMKYSFSETRQRKSVSIVTLDGNGDVQVEERILTPRRDMRKIKGELQALLDPSVYGDTNLEDYLHVTLTDEGELLDPMSKLRSVYPNIMALERERKERGAGEAKTAAGAGFRQKDKVELFEDFYTDITGQPFDAAKRSIVARTITDAEREERETQ